MSGFGLVIVFTEHLNTTASNYSAVANSHTLQFTTARAKSFQSAVSPAAVAWWQILCFHAHVLTGWRLPNFSLFWLPPQNCSEPYSSWWPSRTDLLLSSTQLSQEVEVEVEVKLRPTASRSVCLVSCSHLEPMTRFLFSVWQLRVSCCGAPSLTRG
jgi:hypothetical protein